MSLVVDGLRARAGEFRLADVSFAVPTGGYGVVIGPAGSGKTTLLEAIAGLMRIEAGVVRVGDAAVSQRPPEEREIGIVYQHAYLFPHLDVAGNVAYGASASAAEEMMEHFGITALRSRRVETLSGGERQLVAIARAMARPGQVLLLDEPYAALDPRTRTRARRAVRMLQQARGLTVLHVTHDFAEAGLLGDVAVLLERGRVLQQGEPAELFRRPASSFVADFLGAENVLAGVATASGDGMVSFTTGDGHRLQAVGDRTGSAHAVIRADEIVIALVGDDGEHRSARNRFDGVVTELVPSGALTQVTIDAAGLMLVAAVTTRSASELGLRVGVRVTASFKATAVHLC